MSSSIESEPKLGFYTAIYTPTFLSLIYNVLVSFNFKCMWHCHMDHVLEHFFAESLSRRHLDIGVATGYLPAKALSRPFRKGAKHSITLVDLNPSSLNNAKSRILSVATNATVDIAVADVTQPAPELLQGSKFDSISMFNLFHCVPGKEKVVAFKTYKEFLADNGVMVGCTVLGESYTTNWFNYQYLKLYNHLGIFNNWEDKKEDFERALRENFEEVEITMVGMVVLWRASKPRRS
ncbi:methyltransferase domain-containing protein [Nemania sp. NC0429]|nr:methyltransferase domain-containing protein [Nemania sp. NC0429]